MPMTPLPLRGQGLLIPGRQKLVMPRMPRVLGKRRSKKRRK